MIAKVIGITLVTILATYTTYLIIDTVKKVIKRKRCDRDKYPEGKEEK